MSIYGETWAGANRKCRPTEDWHWTIMDRDLRAEYAMLRGLWMMQFLPGKTLGERWPFAPAAFFGRFIGIADRYPVLTDRFEDACAVIAADCRQIIGSFLDCYTRHGRTPPPAPLLRLEPA